jgi:peptidoglycan/LPS O-acetylase OafA/YrhL
MQKSEIPNLTGLRFVAAFAIVLDHLWPIIFKFDRLAVLNNAVHQLAYVGMSLFFVLSGFIIHHNYADVVRQPGGLWRFFVARFSRLYPLYLLVLVIDFVTTHPPVDWMSLRMLTMTQSWSYEFSAGRFLPWGYHYSVVAWSISTEIFFYVAYPLIGAAVRRLPAADTAIGCAIFGSAALFLINSHPPAFDTQGWLGYIAPYPRLIEFAAGCALAHAYRSGCKLNRSAAFVALGWLVLFVFRGFIGNEALSVGMLQIGLLIPIAALVFALATENVFEWLDRPFALRMGEASYSMYLLHLIVAEYLAFSAPLADTHDSWLNAWSRFIMALLAIGIVSVLSHRYIEVPARRWLRSALMKRAPTSISASAGK